VTDRFEREREIENTTKVHNGRLWREIERETIEGEYGGRLGSPGRWWNYCGRCSDGWRLVGLQREGKGKLSEERVRERGRHKERERERERESWSEMGGAWSAKKVSCIAFLQGRRSVIYNSQT
jgi:hypothetical protein